MMALRFQFLRISGSTALKSIGQTLRLSTSALVCTGTKNVIVEQQPSGITLIGINRPSKRNCVNPETAHELIAAFNSFESNSKSPVAILHGKGGTFCAGWDLSFVSRGMLPGTKAAEEYAKYFLNPGAANGAGPLGPTRKLWKKPVIAAVDGYAVAGGLELALLCDLRVMEESATMGVFCRRFGVPLLDGGTVRLPHLIGLSRALDMILTGRPVQGKEAHAMGLANRLIPSGSGKTALDGAIELATEIMKYPQECMLKDRENAHYTMFEAKSFGDAIRNELDNGMEVIVKESVPGAMEFVKGVGRHGSFSLDADRAKLGTKK